MFCRNLSIVDADIDSGTEVTLVWVSSEDIKKGGAEKFLYDLDGLLIPGGFGERGVEGKIDAIDGNVDSILAGGAKEAQIFI